MALLEIEKPCLCGFDPCKWYRCPQHNPKAFVFKEDILASPDWCAWLGKDGEIPPVWETKITRAGAWHPDNLVILVSEWDASLDDKVKVTLELLED